MTINVTNLPLILCGPILRRVDTHSVSVFVALKEERWVHIRLYDGLTTYENPTTPPTPTTAIYSSQRQKTKCLGKHLHVAVVTLDIEAPEKLMPGNLYSYNLYFNTSETSNSPIFSLARRELGLLTEPDTKNYPLGFNDGYLPSFSLPPKDFNKLNILQASCRKPHGEGDDMLSEMDKLIKGSYQDGENRPHLLLFHGDQIYADDVSPILLKMLFDTSKELLGWHETFPGTGETWGEGLRVDIIEYLSNLVTKLNTLNTLCEGSAGDLVGQIQSKFNSQLDELDDQIGDFNFSITIGKNYFSQKTLQLQLRKFRNKITDFKEQIDNLTEDDSAKQNFLDQLQQFDTELIKWIKESIKFDSLFPEKETIFDDISSSLPWGHIEIDNDTPLPEGWETRDYVPSRISPPQRAFEIKQFAKFTSDEMSAHLMFLGEFYMMYLFVWSDVLWPIDIGGKSDIKLPSYSDAVPNYSFLGAASMSHLKKISRITQKFSESLPQVRRVLANVPVLMMFDDHEVTDDWNINEDWVNTVNAKPMGKAIIRNALSAYAIFQDWGNQPDDYKEGGKGKTILEKLTTTLPVDGSNNIEPPALFNDDDLFNLFGIGVGPVAPQNSGAEYRVVPPEGRKRWDWIFDPYDWVYPPYQSDSFFQIISLDTRTHRGFPTDEWAAIGFSLSYTQALAGQNLTALGRIGPVALIQPDELIKQLEHKLSTDKLNIVLSPAPVFGLPILEDVVQRFFTLKNSPEYADFEAWQGNSLSFEQLVNIFKSSNANILLLSGDVHYAYSNQLEFIDMDINSNSSTSKITQLCSSSLKNETTMTRMLGRLGRSSTAQEILAVVWDSVTSLDWLAFHESLAAQIEEFKESMQRLNMDGRHLQSWWNETAPVVPVPDLTPEHLISYYLKLKDSMLLDIRVPIGILAAGAGIGNYMWRNIFENEEGAGIAISADGSFKTKFMKDYRYALQKRNSGELGFEYTSDVVPSDSQLEKSSEVVGYNNFGLIKFESADKPEGVSDNTHLMQHKKTIHHLVWRVHTHQYKTLNHLADTKHTPLPHWEKVKKNVVELSWKEYFWWNPIGEPMIVETDPIARTRLYHYYQSASLGEPVWDEEDNNLIWSAAFISYIMKESGYDIYFDYSYAHIDYIRAAIINKNDNVNNSFHLYPVEDEIPEIGDIICKWRETEYSYNDVEDDVNINEDEVTLDFRPSHCEIIVAKNIEQNKITTIHGNNVNQSVGKNTITTIGSPENLRIADPGGKKIFGIIKFITEVS